MLNIRNLATEYCIDYILTNESDDFYVNPHNNHVYYWATVVAYGEEFAEKMLQDLMLVYGLKEGNQ